MRKKFDIKYRPQIESGEYKVETEDGNPVVVMDWDWNHYGKHSIAVKVTCEEKNLGYLYSDNGDPVTLFAPDLFIVTPEPELSEFEKKLSDVFGYAISMSVSDPQKPTDEFVREYAPELLAIARKELYTTIKRELEENPNGWVQRVEDAHNSGLKAGYKNGRAEALRDLPRWIPNKFDKHNFETCKAYLDTPRYLCYQDKMIDVSELVEKLPGF